MKYVGIVLRLKKKMKKWIRRMLHYRCGIPYNWYIWRKEIDKL